MSEGTSSTLVAIGDNHLLSRLSDPDAGRVARSIERVTLKRGQLLLTTNQPPAHVFFPCGCVASVSITQPGGSAVHVGLVGREGFVGLPVVLGAHQGAQMVACEVSGDAWRMLVEGLHSALRQVTSLRRLLLRYAGVRLLEEMQHLACVAVHPVHPRLARWLLLLRDRSGSSSLSVTQEFLAAMLSVRRPYMTNCMQDLQREGKLRYQRGRINILDEAGLETAACADYRSLRSVYESAFQTR